MDTNTKFKVGQMARVIRYDNTLGWNGHIEVGKCYKIREVILDSSHGPYIRLYISEMYPKWGLPVDCLRVEECQLMFDFMYE